MANAAKMRASDKDYPTDLGEKAVGENSSAGIRSTSLRLNSALVEGNVSEVMDIFTYDAVFEDMTLHSQIYGSPAIKKFLSRAITKLPYGADSSAPTHIVGSDRGGGYEWRPSSQFQPGLKGGIVAIELDSTGRIARLTTVWDGSTISDAKMTELMMLLVHR
jgi:hypothetical protein